MPITIDLETHPFASKFFLKGRAEGVAEGEARGEARGEIRGKSAGKAEILLRQLHRRFGPLDAATEARVRAADNDQLDTWSERILDAPTLMDTLGGALLH